MLINFIGNEFWIGQSNEKWDKGFEIKPLETYSMKLSGLNRNFPKNPDEVLIRQIKSKTVLYIFKGNKYIEANLKGKFHVRF